MDLGLKGRKVLVTGSTRGIGLATARAFLEEGAVVAINGRDEGSLNKAFKELSLKYVDQVYPIRADMLSENDLNTAKSFLEDRMNGLDILVANIGSGRPEAENPLIASEWERFYRINVLSAVSVIDQFYPLLRKGNGACITLLSSVVARESSAAPAGYAGAKAAVSVLNKYLSRMWAADEIRVNCVLPGNIYYEGGRWAELMEEKKEETEGYIKETVPMRRFGSPEEVADMIVFLSSKRAGFITGSEIAVDGGQMRAI